MVRFSPSKQLILPLSLPFKIFLGYTDAGAKFVFGEKYTDHFFAFKVNSHCFCCPWLTLTKVQWVSLQNESVKYRTFRTYNILLKEIFLFKVPGSFSQFFDGRSIIWHCLKYYDILTKVSFIFFFFPIFLKKNHFLVLFAFSFISPSSFSSLLHINFDQFLSFSLKLSIKSWFFLKK